MLSDQLNSLLMLYCIFYFVLGVFLWLFLFLLLYIFSSDKRAIFPVWHKNGKLAYIINNVYSSTCC